MIHFAYKMLLSHARLSTVTLLRGFYCTCMAVIENVMIYMRYYIVQMNREPRAR